MATNSSSSEAGPSKKRKATTQNDDAVAATKVPKTHSFFMKPQEKKELAAQETLEGSSSATFQWLKPIGPTESCLHGVNLQPKVSSKIATLDLDGTVIKSTFGKGTFEWWNSSVPGKLKELHHEGYALVLISNQALKPAMLKTWQGKIARIGAALSDIPFRILAATQKDWYRKPMPGMWIELERIWSEEGATIDKSASFFVGDAAGRQYAKGKGDFSSTDRKWAENVELKFYTPEEYFLKLPPHENYTMPGFRASSLPELPRVLPTSKTILPTTPRQEVILFVGFPSLGKSTFYRRHFQPAEYLHINQDTLKTRDKCVKALKEALVTGQSCVIDNTNRNVATRKLYLDVCKAANVPVRCFHFTGSMELAWHNNLYRAFNMPKSAVTPETERSLLPYVAFSGFRDNFEEPDPSEGFDSISKVNWLFEGTAEERKRWLMWLQIDGK